MRKSNCGRNDLYTGEEGNFFSSVNTGEEVTFFSSVYTNEPPVDPNLGQPRDINQPMIDIDFSQQLVEAKLAKLNISKSAGPDNIHPRVLKELKEVLSLPISLIFQTSYANINLSSHNTV